MIDMTQPKVKIRIGNVIITIPTNIKFEIFNQPESYYGIMFWKDIYKFQVLDSKLGMRLIINGVEGEHKDLPFNKNTSEFLPPFIKIESSNNER